MPSQLAQTFQDGRFVVTSELTPPKGIDLGALLEKAAFLAPRIDAFNLTDSHNARMSMAPIAAAHLLLDRGIEPIMQMTSRDRNRIAQQGDLLAATALGIHNVVFMSGDPPTNGDHPDAKPVFDLATIPLLAAARGLNEGHDVMGNELQGKTDLCIGAVTNPGADDQQKELDRLKEKMDAGATFFQTQAVYDVAKFASFCEKAQGMGARLLAGIIPLKSPKMARFLHEKVPGINVPVALMARVDSATDSTQTAIDISADIIRQLQGVVNGVHVMAIGWEKHVPAILEAAHIDLK
ncbi:MAG: methylenetetrahydrofolate reductase [Chromatiales bacterium]|jgi:methylenetetrahydrofolate reductase (NADPH)|nr:methylenetetrahydrofolate reductase [Chromatiales bacterium]